MKMRNRQKGSILSGVTVGVGLVAIVALVLAWSAFNRSGKNLTPTIEKEAEKAASEINSELGKATNEVEVATENADRVIDTAAMRLELESRLLAIKAGLMADEVTDETIEEISELRKDMALAAENSEDAIQEEIDNIDAELAKVENNAKENTSEALLILENLIELVRKDIETTTQ